MKPTTDAQRAALFTRHSIAVTDDFQREEDALVHGDEAWWQHEVRTCDACGKPFVLSGGGTKPPTTCSPSCWIEKRRRAARTWASRRRAA